MIWNGRSQNILKKIKLFLKKLGFDRIPGNAEEVYLSITYTFQGKLADAKRQLRVAMLSTEVTKKLAFMPREAIQWPCTWLATCNFFFVIL